MIELISRVSLFFIFANLLANSEFSISLCILTFLRNSPVFILYCLINPALSAMKNLRYLPPKQKVDKSNYILSSNTSFITFFNLPPIAS